MSSGKHTGPVANALLISKLNFLLDNGRIREAQAPQLLRSSTVTPVCTSPASIPPLLKWRIRGVLTAATCLVS